MAKLTKAQKAFIENLKKWKGGVYFRRNIKTEKEQCFIGTHRVSNVVFFSFLKWTIWLCKVKVSEGSSSIFICVFASIA